MDMIKEFLMLFGFGVLENLILVAFCIIIGKLNGIKFWHMSILTILVVICNLIKVPFLKQIILSVSMIVYLIIVSKNKIINIAKLFISALMFLLIFEAITCIVYDKVFMIDFSDVDIYKRLVLLIPTRIVQVLILYIIWRKSHWVYGGGVKYPKLKKKT